MYPTKPVTTVFLTRYSLGTEEFAMVLSMTGRSDQGGKVLSAAHADLQKLDVDSLLSSASHSLIARGFCELSSDGKPKLEKNLEEVVQVLSKSSRLLYLNVVSKGTVINITIYLQTGSHFCSYMNKANFVHLLECGPYRQLMDYLWDTLGETVLPADLKADGFTADIPLSILPGSLKPDGALTDLSAGLKKQGWPVERVDMLTEDLASQVVRGTLMVVPNTGESKEKSTQAARDALFFLSGLKRAWAFRFASLEPSATGRAILMDRSGFKKELSNLVSSI